MLKEMKDSEMDSRPFWKTQFASDLRTDYATSFVSAYFFQYIKRVLNVKVLTTGGRSRRSQLTDEQSTCRIFCNDIQCALKWCTAAPASKFVSLYSNRDERNSNHYDPLQVTLSFCCFVTSSGILKK
jgi:hypothetical protein